MHMEQFELQNAAHLTTTGELLLNTPATSKMLLTLSSESQHASCLLVRPVTQPAVLASSKRP